MKSLFVAVIVLCLAAILGGRASAQPINFAPTDSFGGTGGGPFDQSCPGDSYLVGLAARAGAWVDALSPICAIWEPAGGVLAGIAEQQWHGGHGGASVHIICGSNRGVVVGIEASPARDKSRTVVGLINVTCGDIQNPKVHVNKLPQSVDHIGDTALGPAKSLDCQPGLVASGILGRSGAFIDKIGLNCVRPRVKPAVAVVVSGSTCKTGFVWRGTRPNDHVCVTPAGRQAAEKENTLAASRWQPGGGNTCLPGFVWRAAFDGDAVCVTPQRRADVQDENERQLQRVAQ